MELSREGFDEGDPATGCGWAVAELATPEVLADKRVLARARRKVADGWVEGRAMAPVMVETLRVRLVRRARYGRWGAFPVGPERCYEAFRHHVRVEDCSAHVCDHWMPIEALAKPAERSGRRELAVDVFRAADHPGFRQRLLRQRCLVLAGIGVDDKERSPRPKLRVVEPPGGHR